MIQRAGDRTRAVDEQALRTLVEEYDAGWNAGDVRRTTRVFAADADFVPSNGEHLEGHEGIERWVESTIVHGMLKGTNVKSTVLFVKSIAPDVALVETETEIRGTRDPGGAPLPVRRGRSTFIAIRDDSGWVVQACRAMVPVPYGVRGGHRTV